MLRLNALPAGEGSATWMVSSTSSTDRLNALPAGEGSATRSPRVRGAARSVSMPFLRAKGLQQGDSATRDGRQVCVSMPFLRAKGLQRELRPDAVLADRPRLNALPAGEGSATCLCCSSDTHKVVCLNALPAGEGSATDVRRCEARRRCVSMPFLRAKGLQHRDAPQFDRDAVVSMPFLRAKGLQRCTSARSDLGR